ncbi:hypothetical protein SAY87_016035 [Trapa incisa]|uniref:Transcription termination factor MTEF1, chloroplastic n=1 Tax=Trapa incisa TaxID=236973 RepID=A0AAN7QU34_9MYRT|nr:hypothetical protein SAY87_016035 [Trapa incisa]
MVVMAASRLHLHPQSFLVHGSTLRAAARKDLAVPPPDSGLLFREKLLYLSSLNVDPQKALRENPDFRSYPLSVLHSVEDCLSSFGLPRSSLGRILDMYPQLLTSDPYSDLYPVFDFLLNEVRLPFHDIQKSIVRCPRLLICSVPDQLRPTLSFLRSFGFDGPHAITCQTTVLLVSNVKLTLLPKIEYLQGLGFQYRDVVNMCIRSPGLLTFSIEKNYKPKVDYFLGEMKGDLEELKRFPQYFSFSLEGKIKPRHMQLVEHGLQLSLPEMLKISDGAFALKLMEMQLKMVGRLL